MANQQSLTYVEIDIPAFLEESPQPETTMRFAIDTAYLPREIDAIPSIKDVAFTPAIISLGENLGQRATLKVTFRDHRHVFAGEDYESGTFWGKFRARYGLKLGGRSIRLIRGLVGDDLADMDTRHFIIESSNGPTTDGVYELIAKDVLKLADGDRAQAPALSNGFLVAGISTVALSATLSPSGIGNAEYPASGFVAIGGKEIVNFTRSGDVLTIARAQFNTAAQAHNAQDRVQLCLIYTGQDPADIIADLLETFAGADTDHIPLTTWQTETAAFLDRVYTACIAEPTSVNALISELIEQAALALWWDDSSELIRLQVLRPIATTAAVYDEGVTLEDSLEVREQPERRISQVWTYFGKINPLVRQDQIDNYRSTEVTVDDDAESDYGTSAIKKIFSRWIPALGRSVATRINEIQLGRFRDPPRRLNFALMRFTGESDPVLGGGYRLGGWPFQDTAGSAAQVPIQVTRLNPKADRFELEAEEMLFTEIGTAPTDHTIIIDSNFNNFNLRTIHDTLYPTPQSGDVVVCIVNAGVIVGSSSTAVPAFDVGSWPAGVDITLNVGGRIQGAGGAGGAGDNSAGGGAGSPGSPGGTALYTRYAIDLAVAAGAIWSGAGGGGGGGGALFAGIPGGSGGGGGAGTLVGSGAPAGSPPGNSDGASGSATAGGAGGAGGGGSGAGGAGGDPGLDGAAGSAASLGAPGGAAGARGSAVDGISFVTVTAGPGDRRGAEIN